MHAAPVTWVSSTREKPWQPMPAPEFLPSQQPPEVCVHPAKTRQTIDGFGGCFNELGWVALDKLPAAEKEKALTALFDADGLAFNLGRIPIGASDFALDGYSLAMQADDYELKSFSIDRDREHLLPFIRAAIMRQPALKCWASPWSPPAWMKTNNSYSRGSIKSDPKVLTAYADYFVKLIDAYKEDGVKLYAVTPQNEPNITNVYPTCHWSGPQLRDFIADYMGPALKVKHPDIELWLGLNGDPISAGDNANARLVPDLGDAKANGFLTGIAFQYDSRTQIALAEQLYPNKKLMQSETECFNGANSWDDALKLYQHMKRYLGHGASAYFAWNMVLDEGGMSTWKWKQNALITADTKSGMARLNGEYYVMRHFSHYIKPGAKRVLTSGVWDDQIGFVNPDGSAVIVVGNSAKNPLPVRITVSGKAGEALAVTLAPESVNTFVVTAK